MLSSFAALASGGAIGLVLGLIGGGGSILAVPLLGVMGAGGTSWRRPASLAAVARYSGVNWLASFRPAL